MASRSLGQLTIDLITKTGGFEAGMDRAARTARTKSREIEQEAQRSTQSIQRSWGITASIIGGALAGISVGSVFSRFIQETISAQNEQAQLAAVLRSTGNAAGYTIEQLNDMAAAMEKATIFSAGEINQAQYTLSAFSGIVGEEFPRALQAAADMAARTGMTVKSAAETIGRALDVPSQGLSALSRQGFKFNEDQQKLAEQLEATGRKAEAQGIVLRALEESYAGAAEAARNTLGGALQALGNTVSSLLTGSDDGVRGLRNAVEGLNESLRSEGVKDALDAIAVTGQVVAGVFAARLAASAVTATASFAALALQAGRTQTAVAGMSSVGMTTAASFSGMAVAARVASASLALVGGPIGAVVLALGGAAYAWREYSANARDAASKSAASVADIKDGVDRLIEGYQKLNELQRQQVINIKTEDLTGAIKQARSAVDDLGNAFTPALTEGTRAAAQFRADFAAEIKGVASDSTRSSDEMASALSGVIDSYIRSGRASEENRSKLVELAQKVVEAAGNVNGLTKELEALANAQQAAASGVAPVVDNLEQYRKNYEKFMKDFATPQERFKAAVDEQRKLLGELYSPDVEKRLRDRFLPKSRGGASATKELEGLVKQLQLQQATLGLTEAAAGRYRIEIAKGTEADRARALSLYDEIQAWKEAKKAIDQAAESSRYIAAINRELDLFRQQQHLQIAGVGMGDRQREQMEKEISIRQEYAERRRQLEEAQQVESTRLAQEQYETRIQALEDAESQQVEILRQKAEEKLEAESQWRNGAIRGLENYADEVQNVAQTTANAISGAFKGMEDALVEFVRTGKADFKSLADSIIADMVRIAVQQSITGPLASVMRGWFGSSNAPPAGATPGVDWLHGNAKGGVYNTPSLSQYSNGIFNTPQLFAFARGAGVFGEAGPEAIMPLKRGQDGNLGVRVEMANGGASNVQVNLINQSSQPISATAGAPRFDGSKMVVDVLLNDLRTNGPFTRQLKGVMG